MKTIPVNIISGFLGSGKTTAILRLFQQKKLDERWAIVVNEFGKVSIDGQTLQEKSDSGSVFDISGGCICCSAKYYLKENLEKIIETASFDRIIIEPSGLGGIEMVSEIVASIPALELMPVICMVDLAALENPRLMRNMIYQAQIRLADQIIFSKCDLMDSLLQQDELIAHFKTLFPEKQHCYTSEQLSVSMLYPSKIQSSGSDRTEKHFIPAHHLSDTDYSEHVVRFENNHVLISSKLIKTIQENPAIIRAKGYIQTENRWELFNYTMSSVNFEACPPRKTSELVIIAEKSNFDFPDFEKKLTCTEQASTK